MTRPLLLVLLAACGAPSDADLASTRGGRVDVFFNEPGTRSSNLWEPDAIDVMVETIHEAQVSIDLAVMGFDRHEVVEALVRAYDRGVRVRMVGDAGHLFNDGYVRFRERHIPLVAGNQQHIMHHKFMVVDDRFVFAGTANWTDSDLRRNTNNFLLVDHPGVAADFTQEFEQMFAGRFGATKTIPDARRGYAVGDTEIEVWFAPQEDPMGRILELVDAAERTVRFTIFAFTKDQLGSSFVAKHLELSPGDPGNEARLDQAGVMGIVDQSQLHSNGQFHEIYRLLGAGVPVRLDGNDNSVQPGDYQAGGGRLHAKTMILDVDGERPIVITGSFNWSASATQSNDEFLLVMHGERVARAYDDWFRRVWGQGRAFGETRVADGSVATGDVRINEVLWYGAAPTSAEGLDEFVELENRTDRTLRLDLWQLRNANDFVLGFPPGTTLRPGQTWLVADHVLEPYQDGAPQDEPATYVDPDMVVNPFNDNRQARLYLKDGNLDLRLVDPDGVVVDVSGDGGPAFAGGPTGDGRVRSMERRAGDNDGADPASWYASTVEEGGARITPERRGVVLATPGEPNSAPP